MAESTSAAVSEIEVRIDEHVFQLSPDSAARLGFDILKRALDDKSLRHRHRESLETTWPWSAFRMGGGETLLKFGLEVVRLK
jgi:hypothetical protein